MRKSNIIALAALLAAFWVQPLAAKELSVRNQTETDIINILVSPQKGEPFFFRLDLLPGGIATIQNPDCLATLRVDTGLELWSFKNINLAPLQSISFGGKNPLTLHSASQDGLVLTSQGIINHLIPQTGEQPVCELGIFRPAMPMQEVCGHLPADIARDDNGALLTGLAFGGMPWAARLVPTDPAPATSNSLLEHLELRRPLSRADLTQLLNTLYGQGYQLWQAEFPSAAIEFGKNIEQNRKNLATQIDKFLASQKPLPHEAHNRGEKCAEASIMLAPGKMLPELANADEPSADVQLFTIYLRPCSNSLLVDITAYQGQK